MKKLFLFFLLIPFISFGQVNFPGQPAYPSPSLTSFVNFTDTGNPSSVTGWVDFNLSTATSPFSIGNSWTITLDDVNSTIGTNFFDLGLFSYGNADFPDAVLRYIWYYNGGPSDHINIIIAGLNPAKTYEIKTATADNEGPGDGTTIITVQSTTLTAAGPNNSCSELTFSGISPDGSGNILVLVAPGGSGGTTIINGIKIKQNFIWVIFIVPRRRKRKLILQ